MSERPYRRESYTGWMDGSLRSARRVVPVVLELLRPRSVVDVGCGLGMWTSVFGEQGVAELLGIDGPEVPRDRLLIGGDRFVEADLSRAVRPYVVTGSYVPGDRIEHRTLGTGVVQGGAGPGKIHVLFGDKRSLLVHERPAVTA